jgi:membrane associated rhomboid family serine protease
MGTISIILILVNFWVSYRGFQNRGFYNKYKFEIEKVLIFKEYWRLITSSFLHVNWMHLIFNMLALFFFSGGIETLLGPLWFLTIYFGSAVGGDLLSLWVHRNHNEYTSVGASGAVNGIIFAAIALFPGLKMNMFFIPLPIPAWLFGLAYVLVSIYGIRSNRNNVGHEAHLGGAIIGMLLAIIMKPEALLHNYPTILVIAVPCLIFMYLILSRPHFLLVDNNFFKRHQRYYSIDHRYNAQKVDKQKEVDAILEKIHKKGMRSLTRKEKEILAEYSKTVR